MPLEAYIVSMNRAAQLHLLLESMEKNSPGLFNYNISYKVSNDIYRKGYDRLIHSSLGQKCNWREQTDYGKHWHEYLDNHRGDLVTHFVDDCIFYRPSAVKEEDVRNILDEEYGYDFWGFNWRVGLDTTVNNHRDRKTINYPTSLRYSDLVTNWDYTEYKDLWSDYWAFPYSLDGFTYRVNDLLEYLEHVNIKEFTDPAQMEHHLCRSPKRSSIARPWMASPVYSNVFSNHINATHTRGYNPANMFNITCEELNQHYLYGYKIDIDSMDFSPVACGHWQVPFSLVKMEA